MNITVSLFGNLNAGYTQYPDDYSREIYSHFSREAIKRSQISIHRNDSLMYYGYIRSLDKGVQYIGVCVLLNGVMFTQLDKLFLLFEKTVTNMIFAGEIIQVDKHGNLVSEINDLVGHQKEINRLVAFMRSEFSTMDDASVECLPPVSYGVPNNVEKHFSIETDDMHDIVSASCKYNYTYLYKEGDCETEYMSYIRKLIREIDNEKKILEEKYEALKSEYDKLKKRKSSFVPVILLSVALFVVVFLFLFK